MVSITGYIIEKQAFNVYGNDFEILTLESKEQDNSEQKNKEHKIIDLHPITNKIITIMKKLNKGDYVTVKGEWIYYEKEKEKMVGDFEVSMLKILRTAKQNTTPSPKIYVCSNIKMQKTIQKLAHNRNT